MFNKKTPEKIMNEAKDQWDDFTKNASEEWDDLKQKAHEVNPFREKTTWEKIKDQFSPDEKNAWDKLTASSKLDLDEEDVEVGSIILGTLVAFGLGYALHALLSKKKQ